jgi:aerobic carbon-monoxide dehydrogenase small subunit
MKLRLNGRRVDVEAPPLKRLLDVLRAECGLTGTKEGCGEGECGACTVLVNGEAVNSCLVPFGQVAGADVVTIEGLGGDHPVQRAFVAAGAAQCGICTPGMALVASTLPSRVGLDAAREALAGNLCRCTGYGSILRALVGDAAYARAATGAAKPRRAKRKGRR